MSVGAVKVAVRVRPLNDREIGLNSKCIIEMVGKQTTITNPQKPDEKRPFTFDFSYWSTNPRDPHFAPQERVFKDLGIDVINAAFDGYNACLFAYGQTGSGKSYSMMGYEEAHGLIPRICEGLFSQVTKRTTAENKFSCQVCYLEIYNENVRDLLDDTAAGTKHSLRVREHPTQGPYVEGLSVHEVTDFPTIAYLMEKGNEHRTVASTKMNDTSSRSHSIFTLNFTQASFVNGVPSEKTSKINLVDLAGSERSNSTGATGDRLREGSNINKSLTTLGLVISALAERSSKKGKGSHIPYRDSTLTWLLRESLGGNSKTIMLAALSPADVNYGETLSTLHYANRAKNIVNTPTINEDPNVRIIRELRAEISKLRTLLGGDAEIQRLEQVQLEARIKLTNASSDEERDAAQAELDAASRALNDRSQKKDNMEAQIAESERMVSDMTENWREKWKAQASILENRGLAFKESGRALHLESDLPHLVSLNLDDPLATGIVLYYLHEGRTVLGKPRPANSLSPLPPTLSSSTLSNPDSFFQENASRDVASPDPAVPTNPFLSDSEPVHTSLNPFEDVSKNGAEGASSSHEDLESTDAGPPREVLPTMDDYGVLSPDIELKGEDVDYVHCCIENDGEETVTLIPIGKNCLVNNKLVEEPIALMQGSTLQLGLENIFRFNHPVQATRLKQLREESTDKHVHINSLLSPARVIELKRKEEEQRLRETQIALLAMEESLREKQELQSVESENSTSKIKQLEEEKEYNAQRIRELELMIQQRDEEVETLKRISTDQPSEDDPESSTLNRGSSSSLGSRPDSPSDTTSQPSSTLTPDDVERIIAEEREKVLELERKRLAEMQAQWERETQLRIEEAERRAQEAGEKYQREMLLRASLEEQKKKLESENKRNMDQVSSLAQRQAEEQEKMRLRALEQERLQRQLQEAEQSLQETERRASQHPKDDKWLITIPKAHTRGDPNTGNTYTIYEVRVSLNGDTWEIYRRYSEFDMLHAQMKALYPKSMATIKLPPKKLWPSAEFLKKRKVDLEVYLNELVMILGREKESIFRRTDRAKISKSCSFFRPGEGLAHASKPKN